MSSHPSAPQDGFAQSATLISFACAEETAAANRWLKKSLSRVAMRRVGAQAIEMCPVLQLVMLRLSFFLTDLPVNRFTDRPILDGALGAALPVFFNTTPSVGTGGQRFIQMVTNRAAEILSYQIKSGTQCWSPAGGIPLGRWLASCTDDAVLVDNSDLSIPPSAFRRQLVLMLCAEGDLHALATTVESASSPID